ncbi:uncharacterized protein LOC131166127 [Malania oleifera]|uniref:uncharacterized protein LOC131166127 n=1 Tax=Malania oleifera TaxID=397392 RepID=UPI0025AE2437|nr:uncharacterized protein LOC131166127 [Malania oleifera]
MRIRKNTKISSLMFSHASASSCLPLQMHVCQLNQSPWDVITFPSDSTSLSFLPQLSFYLQGEGDNSITVNGSLGDSIGTTKSTVEEKSNPKPKPKLKIYPTEENDTAKKKEKITAGEDKVETQFEFIRGGGVETKTAAIALCSRSDGRGWHCNREAKQGHTLCEHHLAQLRSYTTKGAAAVAHSAVAAASCPRRNRKKPLISTNPHEFYYYSGFGPWWGKKRGGSTNGESNKTAALEAATGTAAFSSSRIDQSGDKTEELDFVVDNYNDGDREGNGNGAERKRTRKPVKVRSLKSLM